MSFIIFRFMLGSVLKAFGLRGLFNPRVFACALIARQFLLVDFTGVCGAPHAEAVCLCRSGRDLCYSGGGDATMLVSLQPCLSFGKCPPCCYLMCVFGVKLLIVDKLDVTCSSGIVFLAKFVTVLQCLVSC